MKSRVKNCRKCGEYIPCTKKIDGRLRNLCSRKFCLTCSPFGAGNTNADDPSKPKKRKQYSDWSEERKDRHRADLYWRKHLKREALINHFGGKCQLCGYNKCTRSLSFHHLDPSKKTMELSARDMSSKKWSLVVKEASDCQLLCINCHMELEEQKTQSKYADHEQRCREELNKDNFKINFD
jgi:hypothetical protein